MLAQERKLTIGNVPVDVHKVVELSFAHSSFAVRECQNLLIRSLEHLLVLVQKPTVEISAVQSIYTPIVENGCSAVSATESFLVHSSLSKLLTGIKHERRGVEQSTNNKSRNTSAGIHGKEIACDALLVMVLKEIEHIVEYIIGLLPLVGNVWGAATVTHHIAHTIVHSYLVIKPVKTG